MQRFSHTFSFEDDFEIISGGSVYWIGSEEILMTFKSHIVVLRLDPYSDLLDVKFPYVFSKFSIKGCCLSSVLPVMKEYMKLDPINSNICRAKSHPEHWPIINDIFLDAVFLQQKRENLEHVRVLNFAFCQNLLVFIVNDGQPILYSKMHGTYRFVDNLVFKVLNYLSNDNKLLNELRPDADDPLSVSTNKLIQEACFQRNIARFITSQHWIFVDMDGLNLAVSSQRDNSLIVWRFKSYRVSNKDDVNIELIKWCYLKENISCLYYYNAGSSLYFIILGTNRGNLYASKARVETDGKIQLEDPYPIVGYNDNFRVFSIIVWKSNNGIKLVASRHATFIVADIGANDQKLILNDVRLVDSFSHLPTTSIASFDNDTIVGICAEDMITFQGEHNTFKISRLIYDSSMTKVKKRQVGLCSSPNRSLSLYCSQKEWVDPYYCRKRNDLAIIIPKEMAKIWSEVLNSETFDGCVDHLMCLRQMLMSSDTELPQYVLEFVAALETCDDFSPQQLKFGRFVLHHLTARSLNSGHPTDNALWQTRKSLVKVEKLLILNRANLISERLNDSEADSFVMDNARRFLNVGMTDGIFGFVGDCCPVCGDKTLRTSSNFAMELTCSLEHKILNESHAADLLLCSMCDGAIVHSPV